MPIKLNLLLFVENITINFRRFPSGLNISYAFSRFKYFHYLLWKYINREISFYKLFQLLWKQIQLTDKILFNENLIIDTNVVRDIIDGGLLPVMLSLPYNFRIPSPQYDELNKQFLDLPKVGFQIVAPTIDCDILFQTLRQKSYNDVSSNDLYCLSIAKNESCTLMTGDKSLRSAAVAEGMDVHGTIWIVEKMIEVNFIDDSSARVSFDRMHKMNRRLPQSKVDEMLAKHQNPMEVVLFPQIKL